MKKMTILTTLLRSLREAKEAGIFNAEVIAEFQALSEDDRAELLLYMMLLTVPETIDKMKKEAGLK